MLNRVLVRSDDREHFGQAEAAIEMEALKRAFHTSTLPDKPDMARINKLAVDVVAQALTDRVEIP